MATIRIATVDDLPLVVETAARSLDDEAMLRWSMGERRFGERVRRHFAHYDGAMIRHGWVRLADDGAGIAVWVPPDGVSEYEAIPPTPPGEETEILLDPDRHASFWHWVEEHTPQEPVLYLSHIGVVPERQRRGLGKALMLDGIDRAEGDQVPIWLETSTSENETYYRSFGFRTVVDEDAPGGGPHIWFMRRDPS